MTNEAPSRPSHAEAVSYSAFISHASDDAAAARLVCEVLESQGLTCWMAPRDVRLGRDYPTEIIRGIEFSTCLVLLLSASANESEFVSREVERAVGRGKPIYPMRIEEVWPGRKLELFVGQLQWMDAWVGELENHARRLAEQLGDVRPERPALSPSSAVPLRRWRKRAAFIMLFGLALVALVVVSGQFDAPVERNGTSTPAPITTEVFQAPDGPESAAGDDEPISIEEVRSALGVETLDVRMLHNGAFEVFGTVINDDELATLESRLSRLGAEVSNRARAMAADVRRKLQEAMRTELDLRVQVEIRNENEVYGPPYLVVVFLDGVDAETLEGARLLAARFAYDANLIEF